MGLSGHLKLNPMTIYTLESQIKSIEKNINEGKCRNIWAAKNMVKSLKKELAELNTKLENEKHGTYQ